MKLTFIDKIWTEYPVPKEFSIWTKTKGASKPIANLSDMLESCVEELRSDVLITEHIHVYGMETQLPEDTVVVSSAKLLYGFQGNRVVKTTFDQGTKKVYVRYFPANVTYKRLFKMEDLETIQGDTLRFVKLYVLWKMSEKELQVLKFIDLDADNASINLEMLEKYSNNCHDAYDKMKDEILIYSTSN